MKIGELAQRTGLAPSAIRFYEQSGLLRAPERSANGYRSYGDAALERLRIIQMAQKLGFSLDVLRGAFATERGLSKHELLSGLDTRLREVEQLMATLRVQRSELRALRDTLSSAWTAGECVPVAALGEGAAAPTRRRRSIRR